MHRVVIFNKNLAEVAEKYLRKGAKVYVEGQLQTRKWTDMTGRRTYRDRKQNFPRPCWIAATAKAAAPLLEVGANAWRQ